MEEEIMRMLEEVDSDNRLLVINAFRILHELGFFTEAMKRVDLAFIPAVLGRSDSDILSEFHESAGRHSAYAALAEFASIVAAQRK